ncbi:hypothetical protein ACSTS3_18660 [Aquimarina muelleri]|uniref:hypothetical protein n=1 Tax=Aquimarina muelleri TaxID=279356 RepID=UPI003F68946D
MKYSLLELRRYANLYYPFTLNEIESFKNQIDFNLLSENTSVNWSYDIIKRFESSWNWNSLENNISVHSKVTLGLLFPEKVDVRNCDCEEQLDFCECHKAAPRRIKWERSYISSLHKKEYLDEYLIEIHIKEFIKTEDLTSILIKNEFPLKLRLAERIHNN